MFASSLQSALRLDKASLKGLFVHVVEEEDQLGAFIVHHFISLGANRQAKVALLGFEHTFGHYNGVGLKIGTNLVKLKESGALEYIDGLQLIASSFDEHGQLSHDNYLEKVINEMEKSISDGTVVIVDKISLLQTLGLTLPRAFKFIATIQKLCLLNNCCLLTCSLAFSHLGRDSDLYEEDEELDRLSAFLAHSANLNIVARPLPSGKSLNVSGNLTYSWSMDSSIHQMQFRVEEKDVLVFAKGTSSAVL